MLWKPHGFLDEVIVNEIVAFIDFAEERASKAFNRFADLSALDRDDGNRYVVHADEKLAAFLELESATSACGELV